MPPSVEKTFPGRVNICQYFTAAKQQITYGIVIWALDEKFTCYIVDTIHLWAIIRHVVNTT